MLDAPHCPQQDVGSVTLIHLNTYRAAADDVVDGLDACGHHALIVIHLVAGQCQAREGDEGVAGTAFEPWIAGDYVFLTVFLVMELMGGVDQTLGETVAAGVDFHFLIKQLLGCAHRKFFNPGAEHDTFTFLDVELKITRNVKVLAVVVAKFQLTQVFYPTIPVGIEMPVILLAHLHVQVRVAVVHTGFDAVVAKHVVLTRHAVLMGQGGHAAEGKERTKTQRRHRMGVEQRVANQNSVGEMLEHALLLQYHATYTVNRGGNFVPLKLTDVFVAVRRVTAAKIAVKTEVELCAMLNHCLIQR